MNLGGFFFKYPGLVLLTHAIFFLCSPGVQFSARKFSTKTGE